MHVEAEDYNKYLTPFEESAINEIAVDMLDRSTDTNTLIQRIEHAARMLRCSPAQLIAHYIRNPLSVFETLPNSDGGGGLGFDFDEAREQLRIENGEAATPRILFPVPRTDTKSAAGEQ